MVVDRLPDVAQEAPRLHLRQAQFDAFLRHLHELAVFVADVADAVHAGRIRKIAIQDGRAVHIDDVAGFQHNVLRREAMADLIIH